MKWNQLFSKYCYSGNKSPVFFALNVGPAKNSTLPNVVFMYAKSNTLSLKLRSGNKSERIVNLTAIQSNWFYETKIEPTVTNRIKRNSLQKTPCFGKFPT